MRTRYAVKAVGSTMWSSGNMGATHEEGALYYAARRGAPQWAVDGALTVVIAPELEYNTVTMSSVRIINLKSVPSLVVSS